MDHLPFWVIYICVNIPWSIWVFPLVNKALVIGVMFTNWTLSLGSHTFGDKNRIEDSLHEGQPVLRGWMSCGTTLYHFCKSEPHLRFCYKGPSDRGLSVSHLHVWYVCDWILCRFWKEIERSLKKEVPPVSDIPGCETLCTTRSTRMCHKNQKQPENRFYQFVEVFQLRFCMWDDTWIVEGLDWIRRKLQCDRSMSWKCRCHSMTYCGWKKSCGTLAEKSFE